MTLPEYINCNSKTIPHCDYFMHSSCAETCSYADDINGIEEVVLGCGAPMIDPTKFNNIYKL